MLKRISRQLERKREGKVPIKFRFDVLCLDLRGVPTKSVKQCRVVWSRGAKVQMTRLAMVASGVAKFDEMLSQVATVYKASEHALEPKEYSFKIQSPGKGSDSKMLTIGRATVDMARYASLVAGKPDVVEIPINFDFGKSRPAGVLSMSISGLMLKGIASEDTLTEMSMMSGVSALSHERVAEQDLAGFEPSEMSFDGRGQSFQAGNDRPFTPSEQTRNQHFGASMTSSTGLAAQTSESITINSRQSPDSDLSFGFEKMIAENAELKEALAKAQAEKEDLRAACQAAVEQEDDLHSQLEQLRQSQGMNKDYKEEEEEDEEDEEEDAEEDCEVLGLRSRLAALEDERATWTARLEEAAKFKQLAEKAVQEKEALEAAVARGTTSDAGSDLEFHVQSETDESRGESTQQGQHQAMGDQEDLRKKLEASEKLVCSLEHQHNDVHSQLEQLGAERDALRKQVEDLSADVSEMESLRTKVRTLEEGLPEVRSTPARTADMPLEITRTTSEVQQLAEVLGVSEEAVTGMVGGKTLEQALASRLSNVVNCLEEAEVEKRSLSAQLIELKAQGDELVELGKERDEISRELSARIMEATRAEEWAQECQRALRNSEDQLAAAVLRTEELEEEKAGNEIDLRALKDENDRMLQAATIAEHTAHEMQARQAELEGIVSGLEAEVLACQSKLEQVQGANMGAEAEVKELLVKNEKIASEHDALLRRTEALSEVEKKLSAQELTCIELQQTLSETSLKAQQSDGELKAALATVIRLEAEIADVAAQKNGACERLEHLEETCADLQLNAKNAAKIEEELAAMVSEKKELEAKLAESALVAGDLTDRVAELEGGLQESQEKGEACQSELKCLLAAAEQECDVMKQQLLEANNGHCDAEARLVKVSDSLKISEAALAEAMGKLSAFEDRIADAEAKLSTSEKRLCETLEAKSMEEQRLLEVEASSATRAKQLEDDLAEMTSQKREAEQMVYELEQTKDRLTGKITSIEESLKVDHVTAVAGLEREWSSRVSELENENAELHKAEVSLSDSLVSMKNELEKTSTSLGQRVEILESEVRECETKMDGLELEKEELRVHAQELEKQVSQLRLERDVARENHAEAASELQCSKDEVHALCSERDAQRTLVDTSNAQAAQLQSDTASLSAQCTNLSEQLKVATTAQEELAQELVAARSAVSDLEGERSSLQQDNLRLAEGTTAAQVQIKDLQESVHKAEAECGVLRDRCTQLTEEVDSSSARVCQLTQTSEGMKNSLDKLQAEADALQGQNAALQEDNRLLKEDVSIANAQISDLNALQSVNDDLVKLQSDHGSLQDEMKELRQENMQLAKSASSTTAMGQDNENLRMELAHLEASTDQLSTENQDLKAENANLKAELEGSKSAAAAAALAASSTRDDEMSSLKRVVSSLEGDRDCLQKKLHDQTVSLDETTTRMQALSAVNSKLEEDLAEKMKQLEASRSGEEAPSSKDQASVPKMGSRVARGLAIFQGGALGAQGAVQGATQGAAQGAGRETGEGIDELKKQLSSARAATDEATERAKCAADERAALVREKDALEVALKEVSEKNARLQEDAHMLLVKMERQYSGDHEPDLSQEIDHIMQNLVESKMELAELKEQCIVLRNDLYKSRESGMRMAAKMTRMETMLYARENPMSSRAQSWDVGHVGFAAIPETVAQHMSTQSAELP